MILKRTPGRSGGDPGKRPRQRPDARRHEAGVVGAAGAFVRGQHNKFLGADRAGVEAGVGPEPCRGADALAALGKGK